MSTKKVYLRNLLLSRSSWFEEKVLAKAMENGYGKVTPAMSRMFGHMSSRPIGISDLARRLGVSRQAAHKTASDAAELGLVEFVPDLHHARIVRLQFTQAGWAMSAQAAKNFDELENVLKERIGSRNFNELKRLLAMDWDDDDALSNPTAKTSAD